ncbi:MAG: glycosyl hydrolase, partial [Saccharothrix sp.]|nr:glycosyl hydrolase [Saccharothrix sp.]
IAGSPGEAAALALAAGVDVELPSVRCYGEPLAELVRAGRVDEALVDRAVTRVLTQKCELGLLDEGWQPESPAVLRGEPVDLDPPALRDLARTMAERSVVLLDNASGVLPLDPSAERKLAVVGPCADDLLSMMGCYAFPNHVGVQHPDVPLGVEMDTVVQAVLKEFPKASVTTAKGCEVSGSDRSGIADAVAVARDADVVLAVLGDRAGLFGRGTSGEGCDAEDLNLPGVQGELLDRLLALDVPVVLVLLTGRPYALGSYLDPAGEGGSRPAAVVQAFFPGEEGAGAVTGVLSGRVNPSGKLPVQVPRGSGGQPTTYLHPPLGAKGGVSSVDPTPAFPFGHGLSYTTFELSEFAAGEEFPSDGEIEVSCLVRNTGDRSGAEVVQLYLNDPVASVTRPVRQLVGFARVELEAGAATEVSFRLHADRTSFTGRDGKRVVETGDLVLQLGCSSDDIRWERSVRLTGAPRVVGHDRVLVTPVTTTAR